MCGYLGIVALTNIAVTLQGSGLLIIQIYGQNNLTTIFFNENLLEFWGPWVNDGGSLDDHLSLNLSIPRKKTKLCKIQSFKIVIQ